MIEYRYTFPLSARDEEQLAAELRALSIDTDLTILGTSGAVVIVAGRALTGTEYDAVGHAVGTHVPDPEFAAERSVNNAVATLMQSNDPAIRGQVNVTRVVATRLNDVAQLFAKVMAWAMTQPGFPAFTQAESEIATPLLASPRMTEPQIVDAASHLMFLEQTQPNPAPLPPGGG